MAKRLLVFQHTHWEGPGKFLLDAAGKYNVFLEIIRVWEQPIPELSYYDGLLVLGGGPNVDQEKEYPFLAAEKKAIRQCIAEDRPYLGFCLGHQLLAEALGAGVGPNFQPSIGFAPGFLTHDGRNHPAFSGLPAKLSLFKWHGHAVQEPMPSHVSLLATSAACQVEAISVTDRPHFLGMQSDNHAAAPEDVECWLQEDTDWLDSLEDVEIDRNAILAEAHRHADRTARQFDLFFTNFLSLII